jgi:hypothetical protein
MPSRKALRWVPPSLVNCPFTNEKWVSLKRLLWVKAISIVLSR